LLIIQTEVFVICPFVEEETNGNDPLANGLIGLNGLDHLWLSTYERSKLFVFPPADVPPGADFLPKPMYLTCLSAGAG
jgi:hypothetical protein